MCFCCFFQTAKLHLEKVVVAKFLEWEEVVLSTKKSEPLLPPKTLWDGLDLYGSSMSE